METTENPPDLEPPMQAGYSYVGETSVMRYPAQLKAFGSLLSRIMKQESMRGAPVNIPVLCIACSSGEEVASVAAVAVETIEDGGLGVLGEGVDVRVVGLEADAGRLAEARLRVVDGFHARFPTPESSQDAYFVNSKLGRVNELGMVELRQGCAYEDVGELLEGARIVFANTFFYQAGLNGQVGQWDKFIGQCTEKLPSGSVVFTTEDIFRKRQDNFETTAIPEYHDDAAGVKAYSFINIRR